MSLKILLAAVLDIYETTINNKYMYVAREKHI